MWYRLLLVVPDGAFDFAGAGFTPATILSAISNNLTQLGTSFLALFGFGMALRWGPKIASAMRRTGR